MGFTRKDVERAFRMALPICLGYIALGLPCGVLGAAAGMNLVQVLVLSVVMYSGSGQYMIPNLYMAGSPLIALSVTVSLVSSRQMLYGSALSPFFKGVPKGKLFLFAATVTDESFGVNLRAFDAGIWDPRKAQLVNSFSHGFWIVSNCVGVLLGTWLVIDTAIASFAMTSIFLCLLLMQRFTPSHVAACGASILGIVVLKTVGLGGISILVASILGVIAGMLVDHLLPGEESGSSVASGGRGGEPCPTDGDAAADGDLITGGGATDALG